MRFIPVKFRFLFFALLFVQAAAAQQADNLVELGNEMYSFGDKREALNIYKQALEQDPDHVRANFMAGKCYLETIQKHKSVTYFLKAYELDKEVAPDILFLIAWGYQLGAEFDKAIEYYKKHRNSLTEDKLDEMETGEEEELKRIKRRIYECNNGKEFYNNQRDYKIENIGPPVNSKYPDYAPVISSDASVMIFTSRRENSIGQNKDVDNMYYEDIFITKWEGSSWSPPKNMGSKINTRNHDASNGLSPDGEKLFIYRFERGNGGDIYYCERKNNGAWSKPESMGRKINSRHKEASITISNDGQTAFFSSDRPGGEGGMDIYKSVKNKRGKWNRPENVGAAINSEYDEDSPFLSLDGKTLYFSSRGHKGMGGYDIFKSEYNEETGKWSEPENMGVPVNSPDNDIYFVVTGDGHYAYYASIKDSTLGEKDIYRINLKPSEKPTRGAQANTEEKKDTSEAKVKTNMKADTSQLKADQQKNTKADEKAKAGSAQDVSVPAEGLVVLGSVLDANTGDPLPGAVKITAHEGKPLKTIEVKADGNYKTTLKPEKDMKIKLTAFSEGYIYREKTYHISPEQNRVLNYDFELIPMTVGKRVILRNVYFEFDKANIRDDSEYQLNNLYDLLKKNTQLKVEIGGHTDNIGTKAYNKNLSQRRAEAVKAYLVNKGIDAGRIEARGYGESQPLASNDDEEDGRELNRRTEFKILNK